LAGRAHDVETMASRQENDDGGSQVSELVSVARTISHLSGELESLDPSSPAAQLYEAFIAALEKVYPAQDFG
jgi:hypothetical protein